MTIRVGINGFGRIGRNFFRAAKKAGADIDFVAVNDLGSVETMAHLLKYDSVLGRLDYDIAATDEGIKVDGDTLQVLAVRDPKELPWGDLGVDVVVESTGIFTSRDKAALHLEGGAPGDLRHRGPLAPRDHERLPDGLAPLGHTHHRGRARHREAHQRAGRDLGVADLEQR